MRGRAAAAGCVLVLLAFLALPGRADPPPKRRGAQMALITGIVRGVTVEREGKRFPGELRMRLYEGDVLVTGNGERCVLLMADDSEIKVNDDTRLRLSLGSAPKSKKKKTIFQILFGEIWAKITKEKTTEYEVKAGRAVAAIEGTIFDCRFRKGEPRASLIVVDGRVRYGAVGIAPQGWMIVPPQHRCDYLVGAPAGTALTPPAPVPDMRMEVGWSEEIRQYLAVIKEAIDLSNVLVQAGSLAGGGNSGGGTMPEGPTRRLNDTIDEFDRIRHDSHFDRGHDALKTAFINYRRCAATGDESFCRIANRYQAQGLAEFQQYQQRYLADLRSFRSGPGSGPVLVEQLREPRTMDAAPPPRRR